MSCPPALLPEAAVTGRFVPSSGHSQHGLGTADRWDKGDRSLQLTGSFWFISLQPGSVDAEVALGSARALLGSALGTAGPALPSHDSDSGQNLVSEPCS